MLELLGIELLKEGETPASDRWHCEVTANGQQFVVADKYFAGMERKAEQAFATAMSRINAENAPFHEFRELRSWFHIAQSMEGMKTAQSVDDLQQLESAWVDFKGLFVAFVGAYKKTCRILREAIGGRERAKRKVSADQQTARDRQAATARANAEKLRVERVKNTLTPGSGSTTQWFPLTAFKGMDTLATTYDDMDAFLHAMEKQAVSFDEPFCLRTCDQLTEMLEQDAGTVQSLKGCVCRFRYHMRKATQWVNVQEGRVWSPLIRAQKIDSLGELVRQFVPDAVNLTDIVGALAQFMDGEWIHGMREDMVFSSNTPQFTGLLVLCASGRQDLIAAPFSKLLEECPAGMAGDTATFLASLKAVVVRSGVRCRYVRLWGSLEASLSRQTLLLCHAGGQVRHDTTGARVSRGFPWGAFGIDGVSSSLIPGHVSGSWRDKSVFRMSPRARSASGCGSRSA